MFGFKFILLFSIAVLVTARSTNVRIIGGHKANIADHPWTVSVFYGNDDYRKYICSGFLISPNWAVTAGHCATQGLYAIGVGSNYTAAEKTNQVYVSNQIVHPDFKHIDNTPLNDITLLNLSTPVDYPNAKPIALPEPFAEVKPGTTINITGWGLIDGEQHTQELYSVTLEVISLDDCIDAYNGTSLFINETFCAGKLHENKGVCSGDSGGPSVVNGVVAGITSWTMDACADRGFPSVFANISYYRDWIREVTNI